MNLSRIMLYQRSYQPGMQTLQRDKKHLRGVILFLDVIVHQEGSQHELRASEQQEQDWRFENSFLLFTNVSVRVHLSKTLWETWNLELNDILWLFSCNRVMCLLKNKTHVANYCTFKAKETNVDPSKTILELHCHASPDEIKRKLFENHSVDKVKKL